MKTNYHTHTKLCRHAGGTPSEYAKKAAENGLLALGFSDHAPFIEEDFGRMKFAELAGYREDVLSLRRLYEGQMEIYCGLEIEYLPEYDDYYKDLLTKYQMDYLVLGQHFERLPGQPHKTIYDAKSTEDYLDYAKALTAGMKTGYFKFTAHPDLMFINQFAWDYNCDLAVHMILEEAVKQDSILEYNANGMRRRKKEYPDGVRYPYPHAEFWKRVQCVGLRVLINSDCHSPNSVWDFYMEEAHKDAEALSLNIIDRIGF